MPMLQQSGLEARFRAVAQDGAWILRSAVKPQLHLLPKVRILLGART